MIQAYVRGLRRAWPRAAWVLAFVAGAAMINTAVAADTPAPAGAAECAKDSLDGVRVTGVQVNPRNHEPGVFDTGHGQVPVAELRDEVFVKVNDVGALLLHERCARNGARMVLYLDGRPIDRVVPYPPTNPAEGMLKFVLQRSEDSADSRDVWTHLLGRPTFAPQVVSVSVGLKDEFPIVSNAQIALRKIPLLWFAVWVALLVVLLGFFLQLAIKSDVLRDAAAPPATGRKPYSLSRVQAAWWFFLILTSYLFIGLITGDYSTVITGTVLVLLGISAGTVLGSTTIDAARPVDPVAPPPTKPSRGWWMDILSDDTGVNFHRFQLATWTLVLGIIFVQHVYNGLAMPQFDTALLGLMGLSAGTYLGLKTTAEK